MIRSIAWIGLCATVVVAGCGSDSSTSTEYSASIVRTKYGIPHITGSNWGDLGYGEGYAYAQDNFCVLMREIVSANGQAARYFGEEYANEDFVFRMVNSDEYIENEFLPAHSDDVRALLEGYAAGMNRYLTETGVENLAEGPEGCRDADWVRSITDADVAKRLRKLILFAGTAADLGFAKMTDLIMAGSAAAPTQSMASVSPIGPQSVALDASWLESPQRYALGSNAYAIGAAGSQTGHGIVLGNPHFPWQGSERFYVHHLTIPGQYDVMGASLHGVPLVLIGFNKDIAWSHTVSTAQRFTFYELDLLDDDLYQYHYDDEARAIEAVPVTIEVKLEDGTLEERTENIYMSHYGPIVDLGAVQSIVGGWPTTSGTVFAMRDANLDNTRILDQFVEMGQSTSIADLQDALKAIGIPWANTIAADRDGAAMYADVTTVPNVSSAQLDSCAEGLGLLISTIGVATLNGSRSECEWGSDPDGPAGLFGFDNLPKLITSEDVPYVANSNDSYWLSNPNSLLEGFSPLMGRNGTKPPEGIQQSLRTRQAFTQAEQRIAGTDGLSDAPGFTVELLQQVMFGERNIAGEMTRDDVIAICKDVADWSGGDCDAGTDGDQPYSANPADAVEACSILENWDGHFNIDSVGPAIWTRFWLGALGIANFWAVPFDPADPVGTPNTLNDEDADVVEGVRCALGRGVDFLLDEGIPLDRPWGQVQYRKVGDEQIPIHGGNGMFMFSVISSGWVPGEGYSQIVHGNSYMQTVTWDETECPDAYAVLSYSQSTDPASDHYADMTRLYSEKGWNDMPFCAADIEADKISETEIGTADE
ncbi:MAG: penicillin acylase family protein [Polyangiales bacterium]